MKLGKEEFNEKELDVEYEGPKFERYTGDIPGKPTLLIARVTKAWWLINDDNESQMKLIVVAEQNDGQNKEFNGLPVWETLTWKPSSSRRYQPFLMNFDLTLKDVRLKMDVEADDDNIGTPINSIAGWEVGSDDALCRIVVKRDYWNDEWRAKIDWDGWLPFEDIDADDADDDEEEAPARTRKTRATVRPAPQKRTAPASSRRRGDPDEDEDEADEYDDVDDDVDEDYEDEPEEEQPARPARRGSSRTATPTRQTARPATNRRAAARSAGAARSASRPARGRSRAADSDEPPF
jgi:hypothetical protein